MYYNLLLSLFLEDAVFILGGVSDVQITVSS